MSRDDDVVGHHWFRWTSNPLLDLSGLTRKERVMVQASINNERDFDGVAEPLIIQHPRIHLRESQKRAKGKGKDGSEDELKFDVARRMKGNEVRSRCVLQDFATTVKDDAFVPTSSPVSVTGLLLHTKHKLVAYHRKVRKGNVGSGDCTKR